MHRFVWQVSASLVMLVCATATLLADEDFHDPSIKVTVESAVLITADAQASSASNVLKLADGSMTVRGYRSTDGGRTWSKPSLPVARAFSDQWRQILGCVLQDGTYLGIGMMTEIPKLEQHILKVYTSRGHLGSIRGPTDAVLRIPQGTGGYVESGEFGSGTYVDHGLIELRNGTLIGTCYGWWWGDETYSLLEKYVPELGLYKYRSWVIVSYDRGKSWEVLGTPGYWPELGTEGMCEPGLVELADGELLMLFRNGKGSQSCFQSRSVDGGKTWRKPRKLKATGS